jgi:hypothetical protein
MQNPSLALNGNDVAALAALAAPHTATDAELGEAWFDAPPSSTRRPSAPPPASAVGEFLGDPLADSWLR